MILSNTPYFGQNGGRTHFLMENPKLTDLTLSIFFLEGGMMVWKGFRPISGRNSAGKSIFGRRSWKKYNFFSKKNRFFHFFSKLAENWFKCQFWVLNHFKTPLRPFSGHFRSRKSILNIRKKINFFHENLDFCDFLDFFEFWWCNR